MSEGDRSSGLERAARLFAERCASADSLPLVEFLRRHEDLREWLEPMFDENRGDGDGDGDGEAAPSHGSTSFGPYHLLRELGRGGMGVVHEARRGEEATPLAIKLLPGLLALRKGSVARFEREAELARRLDHPGIVHVLDAGSIGDSHYLAMAFVVGAPLDQVLESLRGREPQHLTGRDLADAVARSCHVPLGVAPPILGEELLSCSYVAAIVKIGILLADALQHLHSAGVIHRDVKPSNLLLRADGQVVLTDLGLAREAEVSTLTMTGDFAGTLHYVSPEQAMAKRVPVDHRTDLFSLGSTLYELLTLQRAFDGDGAQEVLARILTKEPPTPTRFHPGLPTDLCTVLAKLLEKDPDRRYADASALAADLRAFRDYRPVAARRASTVTRVWRWTHREPMRAALAVVVVVALLLLTAAAGFLWARRDEIRTGRERQQELAVAELVDQGFLDFALENPAEAIVRFEAGLAIDPGCVEAQMGLVMALTRSQSPGAALQRLESGLRARMPQGLYELERFQLLMQLHRDKEANELLAQIGEPRTEYELFVQAMINRDRGQFVGGSSLEFLERAVLAAERPQLWLHVQWATFADAANDAASCSRCAANLQLNWPDLPVACYFVCVALRRVDPERALALVRRELAAHPESGLVHCGHAVLLSALGDRPAAIAAFEGAVRLSPTIAAIRYSLGKCRFESGAGREAIADMQAACDLSPRFVDARVGLGMAQRQMDELEASLASLSLAVELNANHAEARFQLGQTLIRLGRHSEAIPEFRVAVSLHGRDPNKWHHLASALFATGDSEGGLGALRRAVAADRTYERGHQMLAMYHQQVGTAEQARAALADWVAAVPDSKAGWLRYGLHCVSRDVPVPMRDGITGVWAARRVLALTSEQNATAWFMLGEAQSILGDHVGARAAMQRSLVADGPLLDAAERRLCEERLLELPVVQEPVNRR